jgi:hypothetical protein
MTFTYTDPSTIRRDALRLLTGDTNPGQVMLADEEIDFFVSVWGEYSDYRVAAHCAEGIAAKLAREVDISADSQSVAAAQLQEKYLRLAERLRTQDNSGFPGVLYVGGLDYTTAITPGAEPPAFGTRMHDNPEAGQQDYGDIADQNYGPYYDWRERWVGGE